MPCSTSGEVSSDDHGACSHLAHHLSTAVASRGRPASPGCRGELPVERGRMTADTPQSASQATTMAARSATHRWSSRLRAVLAIALAVAAVALMIRLSLWQWGRGRSRGSWINYSYAVEWLLFAMLTMVGLLRLHREGRRTEVAPAEGPEARGPLIGPPLGTGEELEEVTWVRLYRRLGLRGDERRSN